jgi:hypothetical protein
MVERWNIGFQKDNSNFNFSSIPLVAGPLIQHCIIPEPITPLIHCSIIPIVGEAN